MYLELLYRPFFVLVAQFQGMAIAEYFVNEIQETVVLSVEDVDDADGHFLQFQGHRLLLVMEGDAVAGEAIMILRLLIVSRCDVCFIKCRVIAYLCCTYFGLCMLTY